MEANAIIVSFGDSTEANEVNEVGAASEGLEWRELPRKGGISGFNHGTHEPREIRGTGGVEQRRRKGTKEN